MINNYFPELDYYFTNYWTNYAEITTDFIFNSSTTNYAIPTNNSIFRLLFDDTFNESDYFYLFDILNRSLLSNSIKDRLGYVSRPTQCYISKSGNDLTSINNILNFNISDISMFDKLYNYRMGTLINLNEINYDDLDTELSKMIYIYIDLKLNNSFSKLNNNSLISNSSNLLNTLFEVYLLNESHKFIKNWKFLINSGIITLRPWRNRLALNAEHLITKKIRIDQIPYSHENVELIINGKLVDLNLFSIGEDSIGHYLDFTNMTDLYINDYAIISYDVEVNNA